MGRHMPLTDRELEDMDHKQLVLTYRGLLRDYEDAMSALERMRYASQPIDKRGRR